MVLRWYGGSKVVRWFLVVLWFFSSSFFFLCVNILLFFVSGFLFGRGVGVKLACA